MSANCALWLCIQLKTWVSNLNLSPSIDNIFQDPRISSLPPELGLCLEMSLPAASLKPRVDLLPESLPYACSVSTVAMQIVLLMGCLYNVHMRTLILCFTFSLLYTSPPDFRSICHQSMHLLHWPSLCSISKLWGELISKWWRFAGGNGGGLKDINKQRYLGVIFREYDREEMHKIFGKKNWDLINSR